ncbi:MAG: hypothetical protein WC438_05635 [Candidatus Pacearchaeota archaeon]
MDSRQQLLDILRTVFNDEGRISGDELILFCPRHPYTNSGKHRRKLGITLSNPIKFHCWLGGEGGIGLKKLIREYNLDPTIFSGISDLDLEPSEVKEDKIVLPIDFVPLVSRVISIEHAYAIKYLKSRGINNEQILQYKIGYCERGDYRGRIIIPSFDSDGVLNYFVGRSYLKNNSMPYKNPHAKKNEIVFNEMMLHFDKEICIVEGVFDAISCGFNSVPLLGSSISDKLIVRLVDNCPCVYIVTDPDTYKKSDIWHDSKLYKIISKLLEYDLTVKLIDIRGEWKDVDEMIRKAGYDEFLKRKENAISVDFGFMMKAKLDHV